MHLQTVCILFAFLIVLVLFLVSRSEGFVMYGPTREEQREREEREEREKKIEEIEEKKWNPERMY